MSDLREIPNLPPKSPECTCPWAWRLDMGRLYGISMGSGWLRQSDAPDCPEHANGRSHGGFAEARQQPPTEDS